MTLTKVPLTHSSHIVKSYVATQLFKANYTNVRHSTILAETPEFKWAFFNICRFLKIKTQKVYYFANLLNKCEFFTNHFLLYFNSKKWRQFQKSELSLNLLVVEDDVWSPYVVGRNVQLFDSPILVGVPHQFVVVPKLKREKNKKIELKKNIEFGQ